MTTMDFFSSTTACWDAEFGCCSDNVTFAIGPNMEGCSEKTLNCSDPNTTGRFLLNTPPHTICSYVVDSKGKINYNFNWQDVVVKNHITDAALIIRLWRVALITRDADANSLNTVAVLIISHRLVRPILKAVLVIRTRSDAVRMARLGRKERITKVGKKIENSKILKNCSLF